MCDSPFFFAIETGSMIFERLSLLDDCSDWADGGTCSTLDAGILVDDVDVTFADCLDRALACACSASCT